jgi:amino acid transporter
MGRDRAGLALFAHTSARFGTPVTGTIVVGAAVIVAALALPVSALASVTSTVLLAVFVIINLALLRLKRVMPEAPFRVPVFVPLIGAVVAAGALILSFVWGTL